MKSWEEIADKKIVAPQDLPEVIEKLRAANKSIATLNGSFDLLHAGHLEMIYAAAQCADVLIVACNSDASIKKYKSASRPIIPLEYRLRMLAALSCVTYVTSFEETDPRALLEIIRPDVHVNGAEYGENCIEAETVKRHGGRIHIVPLVPGLSTTSIINKIKSLTGD